MGVIGKKIVRGLVREVLLDNGPTVVEKLDMLFKDVETEGKKQGYQRAAKEYEEVFKVIENEYKETKEYIEKSKNRYDEMAETLINKLQDLEMRKSVLKEQVERQTKELSVKYNIPVEDITKSLAAGTLVVGVPITFGVLGIIYNHKEMKLKEAEQRGYAEVRKLYENKVEILKRNLKELKKKGANEIQELLDLINDLFDAISDEEMKIAELKIVL